MCDSQNKALPVQAIARATIAVAALPLGASVEIDVIVAAGGAR
jgi:enamine deaminase RidA (YjgF/YER057c/UK114 family)